MERNRLELRKEKSRKRLRELEKQLNKTIDYKARLLRQHEGALADYRKGNISYEDYRKIIESDKEGRRKQWWIDYSSEYIGRVRQDIEITKNEIAEIDSRLNRSDKVNYGIWITVIAAIIGLVFMFGPQLTGYVTSAANITVLNVAPNVTAVSLTPATVYTNDTITCTPTTDDWNLDTVTSHYRWFNNNTGTDAKLTWTTATLLGTGNFTATNNITCQVIPDDGSLNGTAKNASIFISNLAPIITIVEIGDAGQDFDYIVTPVSGQNASVAIRASVVDGGCSNENNVTVYICDTTIANECSSSTYNYSKILTYQRIATGSTCYFTYNGTSNMPQFWRAGGTWNITANVVDNSTGAQLSDSNFTAFTYNSLQAIDYATRIYLGNSSSLTLGKWATNSTAVNLTNYGNVKLTLQWNVSNATRLGGTEKWNITNDFQIDDDRNYTAPTGDTLAQFVNLTGTLQNYYPGTGLQVCDADNCNNGVYSGFVRNESITTYFHIKPPTGLIAGTYSTSLWIVTASA